MKAIGIDLGTTNSVVSTYEKGIARTIDIYGRKTTPSVVSWNPEDGSMIVGQAAKARVIIHPELSVVSNKRYMGDRDNIYEILGKKYTPVDIASFILKHLVNGAAETIGEEISEIVVTVPAYFNQNQKEDTNLAAEMAGLKVKLLQAEPTAAAIAYGLNREKDQTIMVYDLGGGTFDVSILEVKGNDFTVKAVGGDSLLGGDNFDEAILDHMYKQIKSDFNINLEQDQSMEARKARQKLKEIAEQIKIELAVSKKTDEYLISFMGGKDFEYELSRAELKELIMPYLLRTTQIMRDTLLDAELTPDDINRVVCVGGTTKCPLVTEVITKEIKAPFMADNVDEIVAMGAAITAFNPPSMNVKNVTSYNLGIRLEEDKFGILIPKNSQLPFAKQKEFSTSIDNATETDVVVFQGSNAICSQNFLLGGFTLKGIQNAKAGVPRICVKFSLNMSDILEIDARDLSTNIKGSLKIEKFIPKPYEPETKKIRKLEELRLGVSRVGYDDVGAILTSLKIPWKMIKDGDFSKISKLKFFDVLFINCLAGGNARKNRNAIRKFVSKGGILYASDCAQEHLKKAFPNELSFKRNGGFRGDVETEIVNPEFIQVLGKNKLNIYFNNVSYYCASLNNEKGEIILTGSYGYGGRGSQKPILISFPFEDGHVIYTAFHNYGSASADEKLLLKYIILKPISILTKTPLAELAKDKPIEI